MNLRRAIAAVLGTIATWWYWAVGLIAVLAFLVPLSVAPTEEDPTGGAGQSAPIVALCTAALLISRSRNIGGLLGVFIGIGSVASAYLWMAAEAGVRPFSLELPITLSILLGLAAMTTIAVPLIALGARLLSNAQLPTEEDESSEEVDH